MPNITLRAMEPEDLDLLYQIENDMQIWNVGTTNVPYSRYLLHDYIATSSGDIYTDKQVRLMIEDEKRQTIGIADIMNFSPQHLRAELGIVIQDKFRKKGYGKDVVMKMMDYARQILHLHQIYVIVNASKKETINLFLKVGFKPNGVLKEWLFDGEKYNDACILQNILSKE